MHPDEIKRFVAGEAYLMKATGERVVIQVDYNPVQARVAFPPALPRTWNDRDRRWLGRDQPALDLPAPVARPDNIGAAEAVAPAPDVADRASGARRRDEWDEDTDPER